MQEQPHPRPHQSEAPCSKNNFYILFNWLQILTASGIAEFPHELEILLTNSINNQENKLDGSLTGALLEKRRMMIFGD
jgi:hypothetical protein